MRFRFVPSLATLLLLIGTAVSAQEGTTTASADAAYWVDHWAKSRIILYGPEEEAFYQNMKNVMFSRNDYDSPLNPNALDDDVQWLKDHPSVRFRVDGYASTTGTLIYNLALAQRRAEWVKQALVNRGVPEDRIVSAVGWGELYPVCAEDTQECRDRNKLVRFVYVPNSRN